MNEYRVRRARPIAAELRVPGDLALSQRAVLIAALANGPSVLSGFLPAAECLDIIHACRALGVKFDYLSADDSELHWVPEGKSGPAGPSRLRVMGTGGKFRAPAAAVDCGPSGTVPVLMSGLLAGQPFVTRLLASALCRDAIHSIAAPIQDMGAAVKFAAGEKSATITVEGSAKLKGTASRPPVASALARDAILLAGLFASGKTTLTDACAAPDHLERLLRHYQVKTGRHARTVSIWGGQTPESRDLHIPGDLSYAAPFITAAAAQPGATLTVRGVGLNATRAAFLRVLVRMGAQIMEEVSDTRAGEPYGTIIIRGAPLHRTTLTEKETETLHDELPLLTVAAALAKGSTVIHQTPATATRLSHMAHNLQLMGVEVGRLAHGLEIKGAAGPLQPGCTPGYGDPHIVMACAAAGLFTDGETIVEDIACVESRWFGFGNDLQRFQSREISDGQFTPMLHAVPRGKTG